MVPVLDHPGALDFPDPGIQELGDAGQRPKRKSIRVRKMMTYFLPVGKLCGLSSPSLMAAKSRSMLAAVYEYGAE